VFGQNHLFVKMLLSGIPLFRVMPEDFALLSRQKFSESLSAVSESLSAVRTIVPSRPDAHLSTIPSVRTTCLTVRTPNKPSIIRPDLQCFEKLLFQHCIRLDVSAARPNASL